MEEKGKLGDMRYSVIQFIDDSVHDYVVLLRTTDMKVAKDKVKRLWEQGKKAQLMREVLQNVDVSFVGGEDE
jgi:hypothetical protein